MADIELIIKIPEEIYGMVMNTGTFGRYRFNTSAAIKKGIPLDDIKAKIQSWEMIETDIERQYYNMALNDVLDILDNIDKESEGTE